MNEACWIVCLLVIGSSVVFAYVDDKEEKLPTKCHVCKHMTRELSEELGRSGKSYDVLYIGQPFQKKPKKIPYRQSELRLMEALEDACSNVLDYKVHKDKPLALRYEKVESMTFKTLKGLKKRGVKVDLGFPDQMWDSPDAEVTRLKYRCEQMVELYEEEISTWYWKLPDTNLTQWLCVERILDSGEHDCLNETVPETKRDKELAKNEEHKSNKEGKEKVGGKLAKRKKSKKKAKKNKSPVSKLEERNSESDSEKIQRQIRVQAEEQSNSRHGHDDKREPGVMSDAKQRSLRERLVVITDPGRLRREIRKIRTKELTEDEYFPKEAWEDSVDRDIANEVKVDMRNQLYERMENADEIQKEIETRAISIEDSADKFHDNFAVREMLHGYIDEAKTIRDEKELRKRLQDLDALAAILGVSRKGHDEL